MTQTVQAPLATERLRGRQRRRLRESATGWLFALGFTILFTLSFLIPIVISIYRSFFQRKLSDGGFGPMKNVFVGVTNYASVLTSSEFWFGMRNVVAYGAIKIPLVMISALVLALILDSLAARWVAFFRLIYFLPYAIPGVIAAILWAYLYSPNLSPFASLLNALGLGDNFFLRDAMLNASMANMTAWVFIGYNMLIFTAALAAVPRELYEAARIDGARDLQIIWSIKLPMLKNAALLTVLMSIVGTVQWFDEPTVLRTLVPSINSNYTPLMMAYQQEFGANNTGGASAISVTMALLAGILAAVYAIVQRKVTKS